MNKYHNLKIFNEMLFVYNALSNGWTVKKLRNKKYKFTKNNTNINLTIQDFIKNNMDISIFK